MDPQEEKAKDLANQCKNRYGNNDKAARKGIRRFKRSSNQQSRRTIKAQLWQASTHGSEDDSPPPPISRRKLSDTPMSKVLIQKSQKRIWQQLPDGADELYVDSFKQYSVSRGVPLPKASAWARYLIGDLTIGVIPLPLMTREDTSELEDALRQFAKTIKESEQGGDGDAEEAV